MKRDFKPLGEGKELVNGQIECLPDYRGISHKLDFSAFGQCADKFREIHEPDIVAVTGVLESKASQDGSRNFINLRVEKVTKI